MRRLRAEVTVMIFGSRHSWSLAPQVRGEPEGVRRTVRLEIQGDERAGYHLVQSPDGFFTADSWHATLVEAQQSATELFGVGPDVWRDTRG
jgi:hypothetical protein